MKIIKGTSTVSTRGRTVIPREIREALRTKPGDKLNWLRADNGTVRLTVTKVDLLALKGRIRSRRQAVSAQEMNRADKDSAGQ